MLRFQKQQANASNNPKMINICMARGYLSSLLAVASCGAASELDGVCLVYALCRHFRDILIHFVGEKLVLPWFCHNCMLISPTPPNPTPSLTYQQTRMAFDEPPCKPSDTLHKRPRCNRAESACPVSAPKKSAVEGFHNFALVSVEEGK